MSNGTSAQLGYTVPFTLVHAEKYRTEDKLKIETIQKLNTTQKKQTMQNKTSLVQSPFTTLEILELYFGTRQRSHNDSRFLVDAFVFFLPELLEVVTERRPQTKEVFGSNVLTIGLGFDTEIWDTLGISTRAPNTSTTVDLL